MTLDDLERLYRGFFYRFFVILRCDTRLYRVQGGDTVLALVAWRSW